MNTVAELVERFCWKSKTRSVWRDDPDLLDEAVAHIHSEAAVFDAIIRSKNTTVPTLEKISKTVKFLEQNNFWRSNPFSLVAGIDNDPALVNATSQLQTKKIRDLWNQGSSSKQTSLSLFTFHCPGAEVRSEIDESAAGLKPPSSKHESSVSCGLTPRYSSNVLTKSEFGCITLINSRCVNFNAERCANPCILAYDTSGTLRTYAEAARGAPRFPA